MNIVRLLTVLTIVFASLQTASAQQTTTSDFVLEQVYIFNTVVQSYRELGDTTAEKISKPIAWGTGQYVPLGEADNPIDFTWFACCMNGRIRFCFNLPISRARLMTAVGEHGPPQRKTWSQYVSHAATVIGLDAPGTIGSDGQVADLRDVWKNTQLRLLELQFITNLKVRQYFDLIDMPPDKD